MNWRVTWRFYLWLSWHVIHNQSLCFSNTLKKKGVRVAGFVLQPYKLKGHFDKCNFMLNLFSSHSWYVRETGSYRPIHTINVALSGPCVINMFLVVKLLIVLKLTPQFFTRFTHAHAHLYIRACYHCWRYWLTKKTGNLSFTSLYSINGDNICILFVWLQLGSLQTPAGSLTCSDTIRYKYTIWWYIWNCPLIERWFCSIYMI